ncbi:hypothetical protein QQP08_021602, partial [Theobroma cacao]
MSGSDHHRTGPSSSTKRAISQAARKGNTKAQREKLVPPQFKEPRSSRQGITPRTPRKQWRSKSSLEHPHLASKHKPTKRKLPEYRHFPSNIAY